MSRLKASMVVSLKDDTGAGARGVKRSLSEIERAERNLELARRNSRLSRIDKAEDALQLARDRQAMRVEQERQALVERRYRAMSFAANGAAIATAALGYAAAKSYSQFAGVERQIGRIALNADKSLAVVGPTVVRLQELAQKTAMSFEDMSSGLETLVASGRSLEEAMDFLPSVAITAQASGAAISDIALSADALAGSMKISAAEMQKAFDILVTGGKLGKFELPEMAQYLPSLLPAFSALGYEGTEGVQKMVAMLQVVRNQAGSSAEAATYLGNVFQKIYSEETAKKFKKFGVDLPKALDQAKREGRDVLDVFLDLTAVATKGDLSKLTQLFTDAEMQKGVRALMMGRPDLDKFTRALANVDGTALKDFNQIAEDSASKIQRLSTLWDTFMSQIGGEVADVANPVLEKVTTAITDAQARTKSRKDQGDMRANNRKEFDRRHRALDPEKYDIEKNWFARAILDDEFHKAETLQGKGVYDTIYDGVDALLRAKEIRKQYQYGHQAGKGPEGLGAKPSTGEIPLPETKPTAESREIERRQEALREYGVGRSYVTDEAVEKQRDLSRKRQEEVEREQALGRKRQEDLAREQNRERWRKRKPFDWKRFLFGEATEEGFSFRERNGIALRGGRSSRMPASGADEARTVAQHFEVANPKGSGADTRPVPLEKDTASGVQRVEVINPAALRGDDERVLREVEKTPSVLPSADEGRSGQRPSRLMPNMIWGDNGRVPVERDAAGIVQRVELVNPDVLRGGGQGILPGLEKSAPVDLTPKEVTILGSVTTLPSGVQSVKVMNPTPMLVPINLGGVTVHVTSNANPNEIGRQVANYIGDRVKSTISGIHADISYDDA